MTTISLNTIRDNPGARKKARPLGRGIGSGRGKTAGHGGKGQHGRSGVRLKSFEGGQTPLARRLPKRGFNNIFRLHYVEVSLGRLQEAIDRGRLLPHPQEDVDATSMRKAGLFKKERDGVRVLGSGSIKQPLNIFVAGITASARKAIESAGGKVTIQKSVEVSDETNLKTNENISGKPSDLKGKGKGKK